MVVLMQTTVKRFIAFVNWSSDVKRKTLTRNHTMIQAKSCVSLHGSNQPACGAPSKTLGDESSMTGKSHIGSTSPRSKVKALRPAKQGKKLSMQELGSMFTFSPRVRDASPSREVKILSKTNVKEEYIPKTLGRSDKKLLSRMGNTITNRPTAKLLSVEIREVTKQAKNKRRNLNRREFPNLGETHSVNYAFNTAVDTEFDAAAYAASQLNFLSSNIRVYRPRQSSKSWKQELKDGPTYTVLGRVGGRVNRRIDTTMEKHAQINECAPWEVAAQLRTGSPNPIEVEERISNKPTINMEKHAQINECAPCDETAQSLSEFQLEFVTPVTKSGPSKATLKRRAAKKRQLLRLREARAEAKAEGEELKPVPVLRKLTPGVPAERQVQSSGTNYRYSEEWQTAESLILPSVPLVKVVEKKKRKARPCPRKRAQLKRQREQAQALAVPEPVPERREVQAINGVKIVVRAVPRVSRQVQQPRRRMEKKVVPANDATLFERIKGVSHYLKSKRAIRDVYARSWTDVKFDLLYFDSAEYKKRVSSRRLGQGYVMNITSFWQWTVPQEQRLC